MQEMQIETRTREPHDVDVPKAITKKAKAG